MGTKLSRKSLIFLVSKRSYISCSRAGGREIGDGGHWNGGLDLLPQVSRNALS
jgi:hypothetical protein